MSETSASSRKNTVDLLFTMGIFIFFAVIFVMSFFLSKTAGSVPLLISAIGMLLCVISAVTKPKQSGGGTPHYQDHTSETPQPQGGVGFFICLGLIVAYFLGLIVLGFVLSTFLMLAFLPVLLGYRKYRVNIIFSAITTAFLYVSFVNFFYVRLPVGILIGFFH
jgi:hypothetical protein